MPVILVWLVLLIAGANADEITLNEAVIEVSAVYPGDVLSAAYVGPHKDVHIALLSPAGLVQKLLVCKHGSAIKIQEHTSENTGSGRSGCDSVAAKN